MRDRLGRTIDYMRVSITDRCNLRCRYCMPQGVRLVEHEDVLRYEEILRICRSAVALGVTKFKITGGEPLARKGCAGFLAQLKALDGVESVTLTTNGVLLPGQLPALAEAGLDGANISLDTLDDALYSRLTGSVPGTAQAVLDAVGDCAGAGIRTKINAVLLPETLDGAADLAAVAQDLPVDVRFIEMMPIGRGAGEHTVPLDAALERLRLEWPDLHVTEEKRGSGPAVYYASAALTGRIGIIGAVSRPFCAGCNRVRLTSTGQLKPCLCFGGGTDLRRLLRSGATDEALEAAMAQCIRHKPAAHRFGQAGAVTELRAMSQIGG